MGQPIDVKSQRVDTLQIWLWIIEHWILSIVWTQVGVVLLIAVYDVLQQRHTIMHNVPIVGHLRSLLEMTGPEIRQYFTSQNQAELPFSRDEQSWIDSTATETNNTFRFGTNEQIDGVGYPVIKHAAFWIPDHAMDAPIGDKSWCPALKVICAVHGRARPFRPRSVLNKSKMSFASSEFASLGS